MEPKRKKLFGDDEGHPFIIIREYDWISTRCAPEPIVINGVVYFAPYINGPKHKSMGNFRATKTLTF